MCTNISLDAVNVSTQKIIIDRKNIARYVPRIYIESAPRTSVKDCNKLNEQQKPHAINSCITCFTKLSHTPDYHLTCEN